MFLGEQIKSSIMKNNIGISEENKQKVVVELSKLLADEYILFTKTKNAHWNLEGCFLKSSLRNLTV